jgi:hypothetical protein
VTLVLPPGAPEGVIVKRDGEVVAARELGAAIAVDPGEHVVTTETPGGSVAEQKFSVGQGEEKKVTLDVKLAGASGSDSSSPDGSGDTPPSAEGGSSGLRTGAFIAGGVGVAAVAAGLVMGKIVLDRSAVAEEHCKAQPGSDTFKCDAVGLDAATSGQSLATVSTVTFVVGVGALAAGAVMFFMAPSGSSKSSAAKRNPYALTPVVTPVGTSGAFVGVSRAW